MAWFHISRAIRHCPSLPRCSVSSIFPQPSNGGFPSGRSRPDVQRTIRSPVHQQSRRRNTRDRSAPCGHRRGTSSPRRRTRGSPSCPRSAASTAAARRHHYPTARGRGRVHRLRGSLERAIERTDGAVAGHRSLRMGAIAQQQSANALVTLRIYRLRQEDETRLTSRNSHRRTPSAVGPARRSAGTQFRDTWCRGRCARPVAAWSASPTRRRPLTCSNPYAGNSTPGSSNGVYGPTTLPETRIDHAAVTLPNSNAASPTYFAVLATGVFARLVPSSASSSR